MKRFMTLLLGLGLSLGSSLADERIHEFQLDNGLKILVKEDHRAPVVTSQVWYRVGSSYEHNGITGLSHMLEHMMFKGTEDLPPGRFSEIVAENGGQDNAFTSRDYTAYYQNFARDRLAVSFRLEADRMRNLRLLEAAFTKEREVVSEERRLRTEDEPEALTYEQFLATAFLNSPYRNPVIGWMVDIEHYTLDDLRRWYEAYYAPNNATLVVVGDVDPQEVLALAREHFGPLQPAQIATPKPRLEMPQAGERRIRVKAPARLPYLLMGYKVPVLATAEEDWEPYALEVLVNILDGGDSSRLGNRLVRERQLAAGVGASYSLVARLDSLLMLEANPAQGVAVDALEEAIREEVARLRETPVSDEELQRVKAQVVAAEIYEKDSVFYQGMKLGMLEAVGLGYDVLDDYVERIRQVTPQQVQAVARKYLRPERLTVAVLDPQPIEQKARTTVSGGRHVH